MQTGIKIVAKEAVKRKRALVWFRKCLRLSDNEPLFRALGSPSLRDPNPPDLDSLYPVFVIDPHFMKPENVGPNRLQFLLESLTDLDTFASQPLFFFLFFCFVLMLMSFFFFVGTGT